jgi:GxxExxY protein
MEPRNETAKHTDKELLDGLPYKEITDRIIAAFFEVYRELGYGFSEHVYRRAIALVLRQAGIDTVEEQAITVVFRGSIIGTFYADVIVAGVILVEIKASNAIENYAQAQTLNYLKAAGGGIALLLNFGKEPTFKRFAMGDTRNSLPALRAKAQ